MNKAEKTKSFIIEKTATIFNTKGFAGTSLNDITEATGLTKGSVYGNFKNKDEVALAVFEYNTKKMQSLFNSEIEKRKSYKEKLLVYPEIYKNSFTQLFTAGGCPILNTAIESDDTHPQLKEVAKNAFIYWKDSIVYLIEKGIEQQEFKTETNPEEAALTILAMIEGAVMITKLTGKLNYLTALMSSLKTQINTY